MKTTHRHLIQIRRTEEAATQTAAIEEPHVFQTLENQEQPVKDLTTYALGYAALLTAAIAVMGLLASTADPATPDTNETQVAIVQADAMPATTMNVPF